MREDDFEVYLRNTNLSENTIASYKFAVKQYFGQFDYGDAEKAAGSIRCG